MIKLLVFNMLMVMMLAACAPQFKTTYTYKPPRSEQGQRCIHQCWDVKQRCEHLEHVEFTDKSIDKIDQPDKPDNKETLSPCRRDYRSCYQLCGGQVHVKEVCSSNCT